MLRRTLAVVAVGALLALSRQLVRRAIVVNLVAGKIIIDYRWTKWLGARGYEVDWHRVHARNAALIFWAVVRLEGLWVKAGQYISTRADVMPDEYLAVLSQCQDSLPARPFREIADTVQAEWGLSPEQLFASFDREPLGSASIAQVHRAVLHGSAKVSVVVKVQKEGIGPIIIQDLANLKAICDFVAWMDPDMNMKPLLREWCDEVPKELDFRQEARNLVEVKANLEATSNSGAMDGCSFDFRMPAPVAPVLPSGAGETLEAATERTLCMDFQDGCSIKDLKALDAQKVNRHELLENVSRAFAHQIFVDGFFNGDPHPGNLLVSPGSPHAPVLLDFGLTKRLPADMGRALAKMLIAADANDFNGLMESFSEMGFKFNQEVPAESLDLVRFFFRDTSAAPEAKEEWQAARQAYNDKEKKAKKKAEEKKKKQRNPVDAFPESLVFVGRVLNLLRGLGSVLSTKHSYLKSMTPFAYKALLRTSNEIPDEVDVSLGRRRSRGSKGINCTLEDRVLKALVAMEGRGLIGGAQVAVMQHGLCTCDVAFGRESPYTRNPVTSNTLFNVFSVTKGVVAALVHLHVQRGKLAYGDTIGQHWPQFCDAGTGLDSKQRAAKAAITVRMVLRHQSGLHDAGSAAMKEAPFALASWDGMLRAMEKSAASGGGPDEESRYHYLSFGWLLGGLLEKIDGRPFAEMVRDEIAQPLGLVDQLVIGVDPACVERCFTDSGGGLAVITSSLDKAQLRAQRPAAAEAGVAGAESGAGANQPAGGALESDMLMLMSPTLFNHPKFRTGVIPSANGHCSARGLATFFGSILCGPGDDESRIGFTAKTAKIMRDGEDAFAVEDTAKFGYGFQRFDMGGTASAFGHAGVGGSLAFCDPASGTSVGITLSKLSLHCEPTKLLLDEICDELPELRTFSGYS